MRRFDYSFLRKESAPAFLINVIASLYSMQAMDSLRKDKFVTVYSELEKIAIVQSVKGSNAIEGIITTDDRIKAIVNQNSAPLNHNELEISGYRDALNYVHKNHENLSFDENTIITLHSIMESKANALIAGKYKTKDNVIMEVRADGSRAIRFSPVSASETKEAMEQLVLAYQEASCDNGINPLVLIPCVVLDFLCIHPFSDGNGRMSRLLTLLLLYKTGFDAGKYISFEEQINNKKSSYYDALKESSIGWHENENNYFTYISNFLVTLLTCYQELDKRFSTVNSKKINKESRIEATILNSLVPVSKNDILQILPDVSITTIEMVLSKMLKEDKIIKIGNSKNTRYFRK